ncbi:MAG TPA: DUF349 domain-containing protein, partial [Roseivirga sp.]
MSEEKNMQQEGNEEKNLTENTQNEVSSEASNLEEKATPEDASTEIKVTAQEVTKEEVVAEEIVSEEVKEDSVEETTPVTEEVTTKKEKSLETEDDLHDDEDEEEEEDHEEELPDYSEYSRLQLVEVIEDIAQHSSFKRTDKILTEIVPLFEESEQKLREEAKAKYMADGGEEDSFEFRHDELFNRFDASHRLIKDRKHNYYKEKEAAKAKNLQRKEELLDQLREMVDGEEATTSLKPIKDLQEAWKQVGPVPAQQNRTLWANYNALLDRFFNNRHILFELKELDRKKNLEAKTELCEKAEALDKMTNVKEAVIQLNELHE